MLFYMALLMQNIFYDNFRNILFLLLRNVNLATLKICMFSFLLFVHHCTCLFFFFTVLYNVILHGSVDAEYFLR